MNVFVIEMHSELAGSPFNMRFFSQSIFDDFIDHSSPGKTLTNHQWMAVIRQVSYMKDSSWLLSTTAVTHQTRKTTENLSKLKKNSTKHLSHAIFVWNHPQPNYARNSFDNRHLLHAKLIRSDSAKKDHPLLFYTEDEE